ncbi:MAG TPA: glycosyltransferase [Flavitalea sp.]|nr:glycosyltransferase [Flavitalea sp.]
MRILHIVENLDKGAVETWLVNVFIESTKTRPHWEWTFYCILGKKGRLDEKVIAAGGKIIYSPVTLSSKISFLKSLRRVLKVGQYDIIHAHHDYLSGFYLISTVGIKFPKRLLQIHNTDKALPVRNKLLHNFLLNPFRRLGLLFSDQVVGISEITLAEFAKSTKMPNKRFVLLYYGLNFDQFDIKPDREFFIKQFSLPQKARILLFAGRLNDLKNPEFVVEILKHLLKKRNDVYALFIGQGEKESSIRRKAELYNIQDHVRIAGWHNNVPEVMKNADVFVFPRKEHPKEGLGLVILEAQAAGLPMFLTNGIVQDAIVINKLAYFHDLCNPSLWADQIDKVLSTNVAVSMEQALDMMKNSHFELVAATKNMVNLYES